MDVFTLYAGQGDCAAVRAGNEAVIIDAHMPECDDLCQEQVERALESYLSRSRVRGLVLTGLDMDHACPTGVESILTTYEPDWVMYPKYYKATDTATEVFSIIDRHVRRRQSTVRPFTRKSARVDKIDARFYVGLANNFNFEIFSPHLEDMDNSNNSGIVMKVTGLDRDGFSYLVTGDTETSRWETINRLFGTAIKSEVMSAPHHGSKTGVSPGTLMLVAPNTVLISAGCNSQYGHPDPAAVAVYSKVARHVFSTNAEPGGTCLFTRRVADDFETRLVAHFARTAQPAECT